MNDKQRAKTYTALAIAAPLLIAALLMNGCGTVSPKHLYSGLDASISFRPHLATAAILCATQASALDPQQDSLTLYRVDRRTSEFVSGSAPDDPDALQATIVKEVGSRPAQGGTFPALFWTTVADRAAHDDKQSYVEYWSDSDNDDFSAESKRRIEAAAEKLAANPHVVSVSVFGASAANWATLRTEFAPLGNRFHLCTAEDMSQERALDALNAPAETTASIQTAQAQ